MVGGQAADLLCEQTEPLPDDVGFIHLRKTAALINASVKTGAILAGASDEQIDQLGHFAEKIGLVFQIIDDLLELESTSRVLGKSTDSDRRKRKVTYPACFGAAQARKDAKTLTNQAVRHLRPFGEKAEVLKGIADFFVTRVN